MKSNNKIKNRSESTQEKIEILSLDIFNTYRKEIEFIEHVKEYLNKEIGWHYLLDLAWMMRELNCLKQGSLIMDAGGGNGLAQFILSELGYNVVNADFANPLFSMRVKERYGKIMSYLNNPVDVIYDNRYTRHLNRAHKIPIDLRGSADQASYPEDKDETESFIEKKRCGQRDYPPPTKKGALPFYLKNNVAEKCGKLFIYKCDFKDMSLLPDNLFDGVVSISALEHNDHKDFDRCVEELLRVTKPGGKLAITISASQKEDWFHEASKGWCYSEDTLRRLFRLSGDVPSNYLQKNELFEKLCEQDNELHKRLASFHFKSGQNGMPWGIWDPNYQPVGVVKIKDKNAHRNNMAESQTIKTSEKKSIHECLSYSDNKLSYLRNKNRDQRCVIIGNGPSLNKMDLSFLKKETSFGLNRIYLLFDKWDFRPTYYVSVNPLVIEQSADEINSIPSTKFLTENSISCFKEPKDIIFLKNNPEPSFAFDPRDGLWEGYTVTYVAMQLAYYMGFREVILIGVDHHFTTQGQPNQEVISGGDDPDHFHPEYFGEGVRWNLPDLENSEKAYRLAKAAFERDGRSIVDATLNGKLTLFPKADYRELFTLNDGPGRAPQVEVLNEQGEDLYGQGDSEGALYAFEAAIKASPDYAPAHNNLGVVHWERGEMEKAVEYFTRALEIDPDDRSTVINCGRVMASIDNSAGAKKLYSHYLRNNPDDAEMSRLLTEVEAVGR